jgi:AGCS family alanine or glycine:cation symporter
MLGPFFDTIIVCTMTALVIVITGVWRDGSLNGAPLTKAAFAEGLPEPVAWFGRLVVALGLILFAVSTAISWSYYGDRAVHYLTRGVRWIMPYRWVFVVFLFVGANLKLSMVWNVADFTMATMAFWNLIGVIGLAGVVVRMTKEYFSRPQIPLNP